MCEGNGKSAGFGCRCFTGSGDPRRQNDRQYLRGYLGYGDWKNGESKSVYLYHVLDNDWSMREYGVQAVVWQTAMNPVIALELLAAKAWQGTGVLGPEAFDAAPFLELMESGYGQKYGLRVDN